MNAASRALAHGIATIGAQNRRRIIFSKSSIGVFVLALLVIFSALNIVYVTDINRREFSTLSSLKQSRDDLHITWNQLLLETNTWSARQRVEKIATQNFEMELPKAKNIIIIKS